ncbi:hypothetical protein [Pedobacter sp. L105]|uniref:hypothetical protein n=1 Tax=Pedobacter sp. L105 TaxID=1641871 RepID=UPI00131B2581|nr:hypothetical protein [Pedobacter sp. L105]
MKKLISSLVVAVAFAGTAYAGGIFISTACLSLASGPAVGFCTAGTYGNECNHSATSGSQCAGTRTIIDNVGG